MLTLLYQVGGKDISWLHIKAIYEWDLLQNPDVLGLRMLPKLTEDHIYLQPRLRMNVKLAAQVEYIFRNIPELKSLGF